MVGSDTYCRFDSYTLPPNFYAKPSFLRLKAYSISFKNIKFIFKGVLMSINSTYSSFISADSYRALKEVAQIIKEKDNILIVAHASPDGDALGSTAALGYICKALGKKFALYNESEVPNFLSFLPLPSELEHDLDKLSLKPELIVILDCGDRQRIGKQVDKLLKLAPSVLIDHHLHNPNFASSANWVDTGMASTGNAVAFLAFALDVDVKDELAFCLYTTLVTDTGFFAFSNTDEKAFLTAAYMVSRGVKPSEVSDALNSNVTEEKTRIWAYLLANFVRHEEMAYVLITKKILEDFNCTKDDLEGFVEQLRRIKDVRIACTLREAKEKETKISLRSSRSDDVQKLASYLGGGGHKNASGVSIKMPLEEAKNALLANFDKHKDSVLENVR